MTPTATVAMDEESVIRLRNAMMRIGRRLRTASADEGMTATQSGVLATLVREGPMRAGDLAGPRAVNPTMLSRVLAHLEEAGLAGARPAPRGRARAPWSRPPRRASACRPACARGARPSCATASASWSPTTWTPSSPPCPRSRRSAGSREPRP